MHSNLCYYSNLIVFSWALHLSLDLFNYTVHLIKTQQSIVFTARTKIDYRQSIDTTRGETGGEPGCLWNRRWLIVARPRGIRLIAAELACACRLPPPAMWCGFCPPTLFKKSARSTDNGEFLLPTQRVFERLIAWTKCGNVLVRIEWFRSWKIYVENVF